MLLSVDTHSSGCRPSCWPLNAGTSCPGPWNSSARISPALVELDAVDELDVGGASPGRHQAIGLRAAVLVGEDHRVAILAAAWRRHDLVPHQQRQIGELADGVRARVDDRRHRQRGVVAAAVAATRRRCPATSIAPVRRLAALSVGSRSIVSVWRPLRERGRARSDSRADRRAAHQRQVLRVLAVERQPEHRGLAAGLAPVAARAAGVDPAMASPSAIDGERRAEVVLPRRRAPASRAAPPSAPSTTARVIGSPQHVRRSSARWTSASVGTPLSAPRRVQLTAAAAFAVRSASSIGWPLTSA